MSARPFQSSSWYRVAKLQPKLREHATIHRHRYRGNVWYVVHDHATGWVHRLSPASYAIVGAMDGNRSVDQLWQEAGIRLGQEAPTQDELIQLLVQLNAADLLQTEATPDSAELFARAVKVRRSAWLNNIFNPLALRVRIWHPDDFFERSLPYVKWLIDWRGLALWMLVVLPAIVLAAQHWPELAANAAQRTLAVDNLLLMALSYTVLKALHELGHGYAVKAFGGAVHELGVMFLVFAPVPYVDASAASEFRSKWRRALVGAAGMIVEVFVAALALYVWLAVEEGFVRALAYSVMLIAGITTVLFNGNPLLRYDGYYILSDILEIPNLAQRATRYWGYLLERYVFRTEDFREFFATRGERIWLLLYAPASFLYRVAVMLAIAIFIASKYLAVGVAIAIWGLYTGVLRPIEKALWHVIAGPRFQRDRKRAVATTFGALLAASVILFLVPLPAFTTTEGVVWLPDSAIVRAGTDGFRAPAAGGAGRTRDGRRGAGGERRADARRRARQPAGAGRRAGSDDCRRAFNRPRQSRAHGDGVGARANRACDADRSCQAPHRPQPGRRHVRSAEAAGSARPIHSGRTGNRLRTPAKRAHHPRHHSSG